MSTRATVEPSRILANIQSTSNNRMLVNHLEENKLVKKGELLVQYRKGQRVSKRSLMPVSWTCSRIKKSIWSI